ncbi:reverse transcriptase [Phytophthora megakarya]|uniref:Reverse transcriptase n=1 Tax=Phytophthora megakarya TaxID=4795 RepID=A0A225UMK2_9STRA|nr:reverse transcriptase [Phytophthora megakarya]
MTKEETQGRIQQVLEAEGADPGSQEDLNVDLQRTLDLEASDHTEVDPRWIHAHRSFNVLKTRIATTPILRHFDPDRKATVVVVGPSEDPGSKLQYVGRTSDPCANTTLNIGMAFHFHGFARTSGTMGSSLEIPKCVKGEDEILGALAASITPRSEVDKALISIAPKKEPRRKIQAPIPTIRRDEELYVVSFDGSARAKRGGGAYSAILWKLPEWRVLRARSGYAEGLTVNEAEYHGLLLCLDLMEDLDPQRLVICGDSNLVIRQVRGEIDCKAPDRLRKWPDHELLHVKRDWNGSADSLAGAALQRQCGIEIESDVEIQYLITLNRLDEILIVKAEEEIVQVSAVTTRSKARSGVRTGSDPGSLREEVVRELRNERIRQAQDEESWLEEVPNRRDPRSDTGRG